MFHIFITCPWHMSMSHPWNFMKTASEYLLYTRWKPEWAQETTHSSQLQPWYCYLSMDNQDLWGASLPAYGTFCAAALHNSSLQTTPVRCRHASSSQRAFYTKRIFCLLSIKLSLHFTNTLLWLLFSTRSALPALGTWLTFSEIPVFTVN